MIDGLKIEVVGDSIVFCENIDRNGSCIIIALADKQNLRRVLQSLNVSGDMQLFDGTADLVEDFTANPTAWFGSEADADVYLAIKGSEYRKENRSQTTDGIHWVVTHRPTD